MTITVEFAVSGSGLFVQNAHDVTFLHYQKVLTIDFDFGARPFAEQDLVALFDIEWGQFASLVAAAGANRNHFTLLGFFASRVGYDDATCRFGFSARALDDDTVMQGTKFHDATLRSVGIAVKLARPEGSWRVFRSMRAEDWLSITPGFGKFQPKNIFLLIIATFACIY
jgi:hypothetical protein